MPARALLGWALALVSGGVWGVVFFSWGLPLSIPMRVGATVLLVGALALASRPGLFAAGAFSVGMGITSALLLAMSGLLLADWWSALPAGGLFAGVGLHAVAVRGSHPPR